MTPHQHTNEWYAKEQRRKDLLDTYDYISFWFVVWACAFAIVATALALITGHSSF